MDVWSGGRRMWRPARLWEAEGRRPPLWVVCLPEGVAGPQRRLRGQGIHMCMAGQAGGRGRDDTPPVHAFPGSFPCFTGAQVLACVPVLSLLSSLVPRKHSQEDKSRVSPCNGHHKAVSNGGETALARPPPPGGAGTTPRLSPLGCVISQKNAQSP